jgi:hypothetical protein
MVKAGLVIWHLMAAAAHLVAIWTLVRPSEGRQAAEAAERIVRQRDGAR